MENSISIVETTEENKELVKEHVQIILRQTNYTEEEAFEKLKAAKYDYVYVIKSYIGIAEKKAPEIKSINQEIYKQLRRNLDGTMRDYTTRSEKGDAKILL